MIRGNAATNVRLESGTRSAAGATRLRVRLVDGRSYVVAFDAPLPAGAQIRVVIPQNARSAPTSDRTAIISLSVRSNDTTLGYTLTP